MSIKIRQLGLVDYNQTYTDMVQHVQCRTAKTVGQSKQAAAPTDEIGDEFWCLQHRPVYTLGKAGKRIHILDAGTIPVVETDRGGQVTYHGPGQLVVYVMLDLRVHELGPRGLVTRLENAIINSLAHYGVDSCRRKGAPGVYVENKKIASLGLRIKNGISYHGLAVNVDIELEPFSRINPCGYEGLEVTRLLDYAPQVNVDDYAQHLIKNLSAEFIIPDRQRSAS